MPMKFAVCTVGVWNRHKEHRGYLIKSSELLKIQLDKNDFVREISFVNLVYDQFVSAYKIVVNANPMLFYKRKITLNKILPNSLYTKLSTKISYVHVI